MNAEALCHRFRELYGKNPRVYRAPGRVNLIGEHTDYNEGFVMPMAIQLSTWVAIAARADRQLLVRSENLAAGVDFDLDEAGVRRRGDWSDYPRGVALEIERAGHRLPGAELLVYSEVPIGSGLSSSAAIEVATGLALLELADPEDSPKNSERPASLAIRLALARLCQRAENEFVGMRCGIMDQFISCFGQAGHALLLDCRSLEYRLVPLPADVSVVVCNSLVKHELAGSAYNSRRAACEAGVQLLKASLPEIHSLRDVSAAALEARQPDLPDEIYRRCRHVVTENERVLTGADALDRGDLNSFGELLCASHRSLRDDYEVSCEELDQLVELAMAADGVYGARMMGGGFGGCTVNLVKQEAVLAFSQRVRDGYQQATGRRPEIYVCEAAQGAERLA